MSSDKDKRQERRYNAHRAVERQLHICTYYPLVSVVKSGKFRKGKALNCGRPRCKICGNPRRLWGRVTFQELRAEVAFVQALTEVD